jgi:SHS2 domain-containing protein
MAGDMEGGGPSGGRGGRGHRTVPHTADVRIEAWGASREQCLADAVLGMVECFADVSGVRATAVRRVRLAGRGDDDLLAALLDEVIFRLEVHGEVPVDVEAETTDGTQTADRARSAESAQSTGGGEGPDGGLDVRLAVADVEAVTITGAVPKAVSWNELRLAPVPGGWSCAVTVDV